MGMDRQEEFNIFQGIGDLVIRERSRTPVGKGMGFRQLRAMESLDQIRIGDLGAIADHGSGDLGVEKRLRDLPGMYGKKIEILPTGMDDFLNLGITDELPEDVERSAGLHGRKVDDGSSGGGGDLDQFESWNKGVFADEFRIQSQSRTLPQHVAERFKRRLVGHIWQRWIGG